MCVCVCVCVHAYVHACVHASFACVRVCSVRVRPRELTELIGERTVQAVTHELALFFMLLSPYT